MVALLPDLADEQAVHARTVLTRACQHDPDARHLLIQALAENLDDLPLPARRVAAQTGDPGHGFTGRWGCDVLRLPRERVLRRVAP